MANFVYDLSSNYVVTPTLYGTTTGVSTDANAQGSSVDVSTCIGVAISAVAVVGARTGTNPTMDLKMQESTDGTTWTDAVLYDGTTAVFSQFTTSGSDTITYAPLKRYQRCTGTVAGTNPVFPTTVTVIAPLHVGPTGYGGFNNTSAAGNAG